MCKAIAINETTKFRVSGLAASVVSRRSLLGALLALGWDALAPSSVLAQPAAAPKGGALAGKGGGLSDSKASFEFDYLSKNGNSSCSAEFKASIPAMPDEARLRGSCCSPMNLHRYSEQTEALRKFKSVAGQNVAEIPDNPYNIEAGTAKKLLSYYAMALTPEAQKHYDYAMQNSDNKGPCCCGCWRWEVYGGLGKYLVRTHGFTGEQVTRIWNYSDGCGGEADHVQHS